MKIKYLPLQPHCFAYGGFDIQMQITSNAIKNCGVDISKLDVWSRDNEFGILHCWGLSFSHEENYYWAKKSNKLLVATILIHNNETICDKFRFMLSSLIYKQKMVIGMLKLPDKIVVVNENQANLCNLSYKVPANKISIIPNIVKSDFFNADSNLGNILNNNYVLTVGNVCSRKNQLSLAEACVQEQVNLVIIGKVLEGEDAYGRKLSKLINDNPNLLTWVHELQVGSTQLIDYYKSCSLFALPSYVEQQPISLLEASVLQKPILTGNKIYAYQKYYSNAYKVSPNSVSAIQKGIRQILQSPGKFITEKEVLLECEEQNVGSKYKQVYESLI